MIPPALNDLRERASRRARDLTGSPDGATAHEWDTFHATAYRLLATLGQPARAHAPLPPQTGTPLAAALADFPQPRDQGSVYPWEEEPAAAASARDERPLPRLSVVLGAQADLISCSSSPRRIPIFVLDKDEATRVFTETLSLLHVAGEHTVRHSDLDVLGHPLAAARYATAAIDRLNLATARPAPSPGVAQPAHRSPQSDALEATIRQWQVAARDQLAQSIPSVDVIRNVLNQGAHLLSVHARLTQAVTGADIAAGAVAAIRDLRQAEQHWSGHTTGTPASHGYIDAARAHFGALGALTFRGPTPLTAEEITTRIDTDRVMDAVGSAITHLDIPLSQITDTTHALGRSGLLFVPARLAAPTPDRLHDIRRGHCIALTPLEAAHLADRTDAARSTLKTLPGLGTAKPEPTWLSM